MTGVVGGWQWNLKPSSEHCTWSSTGFVLAYAKLLSSCVSGMPVSFMIPDAAVGIGPLSNEVDQS